MDIYAEKDFGKILKKNAQTQRHELLPLGTDCFRIYDRNLESFPVTVDIYGKFARVVDYGEEPLSEEDVAKCKDILSRMAYVDSSCIIYTYRNKRDFHEQHEKTDNQALIVNVKENGLSFKTDLTTYTDTGLFLDQMNTRALVKERSAGCDVLNLFSYTGSFSVYAASGLAKTVTSVDLSATYTRWAEENLASNGYSGENYKCICKDASVFLDEAASNHQKYDIVIFDPPSFSNSHKMEHDFDVQRDFVEYIKKICAVLRPTGFILFSTNLGSFKIDRRHLRGLGVKEISSQVKAPGFVKGRKGTVRSWIMAVDDASLTLDWSEEKKPSKEFKERKHENRMSEDRPRRSPRRRFDDRDDRPRRRFDDRSERPRRSFRDDDRPRKRFNDNEDRPRRRFEDEDRPRRSFRDDSDRPRRHFDDRDERPRRNFDRNFEDRPRRRFEDSDRPRRSFDRDRDDRPRRRFDEKPEYKKTERSSRHERPYGFDSFKPARSRNDSSEFFWNTDDYEK